MGQAFAGITAFDKKQLRDRWFAETLCCSVFQRMPLEMQAG